MFLQYKTKFIDDYTAWTTTEMGHFHMATTSGYRKFTLATTSDQFFCVNNSIRSGHFKVVWQLPLTLATTSKLQLFDQRQLPDQEIVAREVVKVTIPGPKLQSQNRVDGCYGKTFGLGAQLTKALRKSNISLCLSQKQKSLAPKLTAWRPFILQNSNGRSGLNF